MASEPLQTDLISFLKWKQHCPNTEHSCQMIDKDSFHLFIVSCRSE